MEREAITVCPILGVNIVVTDIEHTVFYIQKNLKDLSGTYICVSNVHTTIMSQDDINYCQIQNNAAMILPDGGPLSYIQRKRGFPNAQRVTGPDLMEAIFKISVRYGYRHYFFGSKEKTLKTLEKRLKETYPGIHIVGMYSPPFRPLTEEEDRTIVCQINKTKADFIWVGLGAPKQEQWMGSHQKEFGGLMIGVGAGFDYHAGILKRAPKWMQRMNLEWFYRLIQEPRRLLKRYLITNIRFMRLVSKESWSMYDSR